MSERELHRKIIGSLKAAKWEEAKGALRALVSIEGSRTSGNGTIDLDHFGSTIENFIEEIESEGLHE